MKAATCGKRVFAGGQQISIHAAREGGDRIRLIELNRHFSISIHAAREGGDSTIDFKPCNAFISIHAAREGGDLVR